jgi:hypothetical protein
MGLDILEQRQLNIGPAAWFAPSAVSPTPSNQISVGPGYVTVGGIGVVPGNPTSQGISQSQLTGGFATIVTPGNRRYDLVYINPAGTAQILEGTELSGASAAFEGAPGWTGASPGPQIPDQATPVAWILINETGSVIVTTADITQINGFIKLSRDLVGFYVSKGATGSVPVTGSQVVTGSFTTETPGGSTTAEGVITTAPSNLVTILDQNGNQIEENVTGNHNQVYGRITYSATVWTLSYYYLNAGVETAITNFSTQTIGPPTSIQMAYVPKVYSINDSTRPLFAAGAPLNGLVAAEIPYATTTAPGIVQLEPNSSSVSSTLVVTANDTRLGRVTGAYDKAIGGGATVLGAGTSTAAKRGTVNFIPSSNITMTIYDDPTNDSIDVVIAATTSGGFPGYGGTPPADTPGGSAGSSSLVSRSDHAHPLSSDYAETTGYIHSSAAGSLAVANPRIAVGVSVDGAGNYSAGIAVSTSQQDSIPDLSGSFLKCGTTQVDITSFTSGSQAFSGGNTGTYSAFVLGQVGV